MKDLLSLTHLSSICLLALTSLVWPQSERSVVSEEEQAIRNRIEADNRALAAARRKVADNLEKAATKRFLDPTREIDSLPDPRVPEGKWILWYQNPGSFWTEALPLGNGRLGAMVFGGIQREIIQLNEDTLWSGKPIARARPDAAQYPDRARALLFAGRYEEGQQLVNEKIMGLRLERGIHTYQTLGNLEFDFEYSDATVRNYQRQLNLDQAISTVSYQVGEVDYQREVFISAPDQGMVMRVSASESDALSFRVSFTRPRDAEIAFRGENRIVMMGHADAGNGVQFAAQVQVISRGGQCSRVGSKLEVKNANSALILLTAATDYRGTEAKIVSEKQLEALTARDYSDLRSRHLEDHQALFRRVDLDLGKSARTKLPTDQRIDFIKDGNSDPHLLALYFQFGRYLLIASSRPETMPANLQGIWAGGMTPPWNADYHLNINLQMNYWPAEVTNLAECHKPMFDLIEALRPRGRVTARDTYGLRGWVAHHTTDAWWFTDVIGIPQYGMWPFGAAWCCQHLWEHYLFGGDRDFLAKRAYPAMKEAAQFLLDWLVEDPRTGLLISGPSTSPENKFITKDWKQYGNLSMGTTMDHMIIRDLFTNCIEAALTHEVDAEFQDKLQDALSRLTPVPIGEDGRIMEWLEPFHEEDPGHRHMSHMFGLHPGRQITELRTPQLFRAARKSLKTRLAPGYRGVGWSRAWNVNFFARLKDGAAAHENLRRLVGQASSNLFNGKFQIDANFGACAGVAEMLVQSHSGHIELLPALPPAWPKGYVRGLRARGGFEIDMEWDQSELQEATIRSSFGGTCRLLYGGTTAEINLESGASVELNRRLQRLDRSEALKK